MDWDQSLHLHLHLETATTFEALLSKLIVYCAFLLVTEDFKGL